MKKKVLLLVISLALIISAIPCMLSAADTIPEANITYDSNQIDPIIISESGTAKLSGCKINVTADSKIGSAIAITNASTVNLIVDGDCILRGNAEIVGAGIYVEEGSTLNLYGTDGSRLKVTGGKYSAGIGGIGYKDATITNPNCGEINIYSGNVTAIGGARGAGIGSGYHSSVSKINILGGNITAFGTECASGIGTGYGTSGGAFVDNDGNPTASGVGFYNGGNITISGGTIRAASYNIDFNSFDKRDPSTLYTDASGNNYDTGSFAAGIGGGYGASSGNIVINGDADVVAIGGCGGAGIGSGRGTSKAANYDASHFFVNVTIGGNAKVVAAATDDLRNNQGGGAGIGSGRGANTAGTIKILDSANVYAVASPYAAAIGGSWKVGSLPFTSGKLNDNAANMNAMPESIEISSTASVFARNDSSRDAISNYETIPNLVNTYYNGNFIDEEGAILPDSAYPMLMGVASSANTNHIFEFILPENAKNNIMVVNYNVNQYQVLAQSTYFNETKVVLDDGDLAKFDVDFIKGYNITKLGAAPTVVIEDETPQSGTPPIVIDDKTPGSAAPIENGATNNTVTLTDSTPLASAPVNTADENHILLYVAAFATSCGFIVIKKIFD